jgi:hypothetical protein
MDFEETETRIDCAGESSVNSTVRLQLGEVTSWWLSRGEFGNSEEGERPPLKAATKQRLVTNEKILCVL